MSDSFEGDIIRPLGLVTLYFAYAEHELDELLKVLSVHEPYDDKKRQWMVGQKLQYALELIRKLDANELAGLISSLDEARQLFERRNLIIHSRIYTGGRLVSNRRNAPARVTPDELTKLADLIFTCKERISMNCRKYVLPVLTRLGYHNEV